MLLHGPSVIQLSHLAAARLASYWDARLAISAAVLRNQLTDRASSSEVWPIAPTQLRSASA